MTLPCSVENRLYRHIHKWAPVMPDREVDILMDKVFELMDELRDFERTHLRHDGFYKHALNVWADKLEKIKPVLAQLFYHGYVFSYTVRQLKIVVLWAESHTLELHESLLSRLKQQFERVCAESGVCERDEQHDLERYESDLFQFRKTHDMMAEVDLSEYDILPSYTHRLFEENIRKGHSSTTHYMALKIEGARFQFELVPPDISFYQRLTTERKAERETATTTMKEVSNKWRKLRAS